MQTWVDTYVKWALSYQLLPCIYPQAQKGAKKKKKKVGLCTKEHTTRDTTMETLMASGTVLACK